MSPILIAVAAWVSIMFIGMAIGMGTLKNKSIISDSEKERRVVAASVGGGIGLLSAIAFAALNWGDKMTAPFWAGLALVAFGLTTAIYMVVPKKVHPSDASQCEAQGVTTVVTSVALALSVLAYVGAVWYSKQGRRGA